MYAIIKTGGKQYKVRQGDTVDVELLDGEIGDIVELDQVLMVADDGEMTVGTPTVEDAVVRATVVDEVRGDKVVVLKYKPKNRYARKTGHRQNYTRLQIDEIVAPGYEAEVEETVEEAPPAEAPAAEIQEATTETIEVEAAKEAEPVVEVTEEIDESEEAVEEPEIEAELESEEADELIEAVEEPETEEVEDEEE